MTSQIGIKLLIAAVILPWPVAGAEIHKCVDEAGKVAFQDAPCPADLRREAEMQARELERRREATRRWDERMARLREELAAKPIPKEAYIPTLSEAEFRDRLGTYAAVMGKAAACDIDDAGEFGAALGRAIDARYGKGSREQQLSLRIVAEGMKSSAQQQLAGRAPDDCDTVRREFPRIPRP